MSYTRQVPSSFDGVRRDSFSEKETQCQLCFNEIVHSGKRFFHLCTSGERQQIIFQHPGEYAAGINLAATSAFDTKGLRIITFELMSNHVHFIVKADDEVPVRKFFDLFSRRLSRCLGQKGGMLDFSGFIPKMIPIESLDSLRNQIVYTNRNNYLVDPDHTPFSYPYGANSFFFLPIIKEHGSQNYGDLTVREKRELTHSHSIDYPDCYRILHGYISPGSFCDIQLGERFFRDARHYFHKISRDISSYKEIASLVGDSVYYTDDELVSIVFSIARKEYDNTPSQLTIREKIDLAKRLHYDYNADNEKIARLLRVPATALGEVFLQRR